MIGTVHLAESPCEDDLRVLGFEQSLYTEKHIINHDQDLHTRDNAAHPA